MKKLREVIVKEDDANPIPVEVMAASIKSISEGIRVLRKSRLNDKALVLLIEHACPAFGPAYSPKKRPSARDIRSVLEGIEALERTYLKAKS